MLYRANRIVTPAFLKVSAILLAILGFSSAAFAVTNTGAAPELVPYSINVLAGNAQSAIGGFGGDGNLGVAATLNGSGEISVDTIGNVYVADSANAIIREISAQTGFIATVAGIVPSGCVGTVCKTTTPGCSDGVPAVGNPAPAGIGGIWVDGFGNVFFSSSTYQSVYVIYKGGANVAAFITLVDAASVSASGPIPGYVYHIGGVAAPKAGGGCTSAFSPTTDKVLATSATLHNPGQIGLDGGGNIFIQDNSNQVVRVINTQNALQTFLGVTVAPGFMGTVVGCNSTLSTICGLTTVFGSSATGAGALYSTNLAGMGADEYGNIYENDTKGAVLSYSLGAYQGGDQLKKLIFLEEGLTAAPGDFYEVINSVASSNAPGTEPQAIQANASNNINLRPTAITTDPYGNIYMQDYHWIMIFRVDYNSQMVTRLLSTAAQVATPTVPAYCNGTTTTTLGGPTGPTTIDKYGDGCPVTQAKLNAAGTGEIVFDPTGNGYIIDSGNNTVRKVTVNTQFPAVATGTPLSQTIQMHFDPTNLPTVGAVSTIIPSNLVSSAATYPVYSTTSFSIVAGASDFSIASTTAPATCANYTLNLDKSLECYIPVVFTPSLPGLRRGTLQVTTANGSMYNVGITGVGSGSQLVVDGGTATKVAATGLGKSSAVAVGPDGTVYIADSANNQVLAIPNGTGTPTKIGTGLSNPMGVAVDAASNVYISDTGHNQVVEVASLTGTQTTLLPLPTGLTPGGNSGIVARSPVLTLKAPQGLAVDSFGNLYVADTGNSRVVQLSSWGEYGPAPMLEYPGAPKLVNPVGLAVDYKGDIFVADTGLRQIVEIFPSGGDLLTPIPSTTAAIPILLPAFGQNLTTPSGVAVDAAGDLYVSDSTLNQVVEIPGSVGPGSEQVTLNFSGTSFSPAGVALDNSGNLYVADPGDSQVMFVNRSAATINFGTIPQYLSPITAVPVTFLNVGTGQTTLSTPFAGTPSGNTSSYGLTAAGLSVPCAAGQRVLSGIHCTLTASFNPQMNGPLSEAIAIQGGLDSLTLTGIGVSPLANIVLAVTAPSGGAVVGSPATVTATVTQSNGPKNTPTGTVSFSYTVDGVSGGAATVVPLSGTTASFSLPTLLKGRLYIISAIYSGDSLDSQTTATPLSVYIPGTPVTVISSSISQTYGSAIPALTGTVTGILDSSVSYKFVTTATSKSPLGVYPIYVVFSGGTAADYGYGPYPPVLTASGAPATVTITPAPLALGVVASTVQYGHPDIGFSTIPNQLAAVNGDTFTVSYSSAGQNPLHTSTLPVGTYTVLPAISTGPVGNYTVKVSTGTLIVTQAPTTVTATAAVGAVLPTNLTAAPISISVVTAVSQGLGVPTGTVTITDAFTPITPTGTTATVTSTIGPLTLVAGAVTYTPTSTTLGTHVYTTVYSGDSNFQTSTTLTTTKVIVDIQDFTINSTLSPIQVVPGIIPGGNASIAGEQAATPENATVSIAPILGFTGVVTLTCASPNSYVSCALTPPTVTLTGTATVTSVFTVQTPATLPIGFTSQLQGSKSRTVLAFLPLGVLAFLPLCFRSRRRLSKALWMMIALAAITVGMSGCGGNLVQFYTPVPAGPQNITITATAVSPTNGSSLSRQFVIVLNVQ